jgi:hypothetical protein
MQLLLLGKMLWQNSYTENEFMNLVSNDLKLNLVEDNNGQFNILSTILYINKIWLFMFIQKVIYLVYIID